MKLKREAVLVLLSGCLAAASARAQFAAQPGTAAFEREASVLYSMGRYDGDEEIQLIRRPHRADFEIRFVRGKKTLFSIPAHDRTVFKAVKGVIYYVIYGPSASGGTVVAYDLPRRKELWRRELPRLATYGHSAYFSLLTIDAGEKWVNVRGQESAGNFFASLDTKTGTVVTFEKTD